MKKYLLVVLVFFGICKIGYAQNYKLFQEDSLRLYIAGNYGIYGLFFDSVSIQGFDTTYYNFGVVGNASNGCIVINQPIFIGKKVLIKSDGTTVLFNAQEDSIFLHTNAQPGDSWEMYRFANGDKVIAYMYPTYTYSILNSIDSVKTIVMSVLNINGVPIASPLNNNTIKISKEHGIYVGTDFSAFPNYYVEYTLLNKRMMTKGDFYHYLPGDTIQTWTQCQLGSQLGPYTYSTNIICDAYYSANSDTLFYNTSCSQGYYFMTDLNEPIIQGFPGRLINNDCHYYQISYGSFCNPTGLTVWETSMTGDFIGVDSCYYQLFEPASIGYLYNEGMGEILESHSDGPSGPGSYSCSEGVMFFRHGTNRCGTFLNTTLNIDDLLAKSQSHILDFSPNPVVNQIEFVKNDLTSTEDDIAIEIYDVTGKLLLKKPMDASESKMQIDLSEFNSGLYFFSAKSDSRIFQNGKFIKMQ
ncbi:MAG: T9SS type A sorting domain-containing protein [Bacteroidia bacterium]|nr:T9SS type A sorting domain-containing protein [Bacteroidia bacterium]